MKPEALFRVPVGLASPLWGLFAGAAMGGAAWWWMTRLARPANLEALFGEAAKVEAPVAALEAPLAAEAIAELVDPEPEAVAEPVLEAAPPIEAPTPESIVEPPVLEAPVGGEAAPISPVLAAVEPEPKLEAAPTPTPKAKKAVVPKANPAE